MATFGYTAVPASTSNTSVSTIQDATPTTAVGSSGPTFDGTISKLTAYVGNSSGVNRPIGLAIWADSAGLPGALLKDFGTVTITAGQALGWVDWPGTLAVTSGTTYWLGFYSVGDGGNHAQVGMDVGASGSSRYHIVSGVPTNPFGSATADTPTLAIYATYAASVSDTAQNSGSAAPFVTIIGANR